MDLEIKQTRFEELVMPHLDAAYNLARWLTGNEHDAQDVVQEAYLRAYKFFSGFHGVNGRSWLLSIVRNASYTWLHKNRRHELLTPAEADQLESENPANDPGDVAAVNMNKELLRLALERLPAEFREIIVLRELEGLSYKEIAGVASVPIGTVMSRLARAREHLRKELARGFVDCV